MPRSKTDYRVTREPTVTEQHPGGVDLFWRGDQRWALPAGGVPAAHAASHQDGGSDEISVTGLSGLLADRQTPIPDYDQSILATQVFGG